MIFTQYDLVRLVCYMSFLWLTAVWIHKADVMWCLLQYCQTLFIVLFAWIDTVRCNAVFTVILSDWCVDWQGKRAAFVTSKRMRNTLYCDYYSHCFYISFLHSFSPVSWQKCGDQVTNVCFVLCLFANGHGLVTTAKCLWGWCMCCRRGTKYSFTVLVPPQRRTVHCCLLFVLSVC